MVRKKRPAPPPPTTTIIDTRPAPPSPPLNDNRTNLIQTNLSSSDEPFFLFSQSEDGRSLSNSSPR